MDVGANTGTSALLTTADLAARPDFQLGEATVSPSARIIRGPGGETELEPRVMQVLLILADAAGTVVTRETLFRRCWGNVYVGDDSLNRAVAGARRATELAAAGSIQIETIPRTGYRLNVLQGAQPHTGIDVRRTRPTRRLVIAGGVAGAALAGGVGLWSALRDPVDPRFVALMARGDEALRDGSYGEPDVAAIYDRAVRLEPRNAKSWGLFAFFTATQVEDAEAKDAARLTEETNYRARRALEIDPQEPNALVAMYVLQGPMFDWATRDGRIREIISINPNNIPAMRELMVLLQAVGLARESWGWNERILQLAPLSRPHLALRALKLWILGRVAEADRVIDRVRGLWPLDNFGFYVRFTLFAMTGRPQAALAMLNSGGGNDPGVQNVALWRIALEALETRSPQAIEAARAAYFEAAKKAPMGVNNAVMVLGSLGQIDAAFELADGYLLWRGKVVSANKGDAKVLNDFNRRMTPWLFTPPLAAMRADPRFLKLCEEFGLTAYWRARGVNPDYLTYRS